MVNLLKKGPIDFLNTKNTFKHAIKDFDPFKRLKQKKRHKKIYFATSLCFILLVLVLGYYYFSLSQEISRINKEAAKGMKSLSSSINGLKQSEYTIALANVKNAEEEFTQIINSYERLGKNILWSCNQPVKQQAGRITELLSGATVLAQDVSDLAELGIAMNKLATPSVKFSSLSGKELQAIFTLLFQNTPELNGIKAGVDLAGLTARDLDIKFSWPFEPYGELASNWQKDLADLELYLKNILPSVELLPPLVGYPQESRFLVAFLDNQYWQPVGMQIKALGIIEIENSRITDYEFYNVPAQLQSRSDNSLGWPEAAVDLYKLSINKFSRIKTAPASLTGVIGINYDALAALLELLGPVIAGRNEIEVDATNFYSLLDNEASEQEDDLFGALFNGLYGNLRELKLADIHSVLGEVNKRLYGKDILLHFADPGNEETVAKYRWGGLVTAPDSDFLFVSTTGNGRYPTELLGQSIEYRLDEGANGLFSRTRINYSNRADNDPTALSVRLFIPTGSQVIRIYDASDNPLSQEEFTAKGQADKAVIEVDLLVNPKSINSIEVYYKLPQHLSNQIKQGQYSLVTQVQPGSRAEPFLVDLKFEKKIKAYVPFGFFSFGGENSVRWETMLDSDQEFNVFFK